MKNIEEIREKLGPDYRVEEKDGVITVCDIWDGVEFARCVREYDGQFSDGGIYRIKTIEGVLLYFHNDDGGDFNSLGKECFTPATEDEYVEQLKIEADIRFGDIKDGDRFVRGFHSPYNEIFEFTVSNPKEYSYDITNDALLIDDMWVYHKGKWAEKIKSRVSVEVTDLSSIRKPFVSGKYYNIQFKTNDYSRAPSLSDISQHLSKCLEEYLNNK